MKHLTAWSKKASIVLILRGMDTKDLADRMGWTNVYTVGYLSGRNNSPSGVSKISGVLGISNADTLDDLPAIIVRELKKKENRK